MNFHISHDLKGVIRSLNSRDNEERAEALKIFQEKDIVINNDTPHTQINVQIGHNVTAGGKVIDTGDKSLNLSKLKEAIQRQFISLKPKKSLYCSSCGNAIEGNTRFCINCGNPINLD